MGVFNQYHYRAETRAALEQWERALLGLVGLPAATAVSFPMAA
ncbi:MULTISPECIES: hypothetical protein [Thiorhodovibrio]|nr:MULTISPECIES: hypothetical protein [Thiorhodovibrio]